MSRYPRIEIKEPVIDVIGDSFILEGSYKPSFFRRAITVTIEGSRPPYANGHLVVYERHKIPAGVFFSHKSYDLITVLGPYMGTKDVIPGFQKRLKNRLAELARR